MEAIKLEVERIVQPLPARERLKDIFREELWGHLLILVQEEQAAGRNEDDPLKAALRRLGSPAALRAEFLASLRCLDRFEGYLLKLVFPGARGNSWQQSVLPTAGVALRLYGFFLLLLLLTYPLPNMNPGSYILSALSFGLVLFVVAVQGCSFKSLSNPLLKESFSFRSFLRPLVCSGAAVFGAWLVGLGLLAPALRVFERTELLPVYNLFGLQVLGPLWALLTLVCAGLAAWNVRRSRPLPNWPYLIPG